MTAAKESVIKKETVGKRNQRADTAARSVHWPGQITSRDPTNTENVPIGTVTILQDFRAASYYSGQSSLRAGSIKGY